MATGEERGCASMRAEAFFGLDFFALLFLSRKKVTNHPIKYTLHYQSTINNKISTFPHEHSILISLQQLDPGLYKIRINKSPSILPDRKNVPRPSAHLLLVKGKGEKRTYQIDNEPTFTYAHYEEGEIQIIKKLSSPHVEMPSIYLTWRDEEGDDYSLKVYDAWNLRELFDEREYLRTPFNFKPKRKV